MSRIKNSRTFLYAIKGVKLLTEAKDNLLVAF